MPEVIFNGPEGRLEGRFIQNKKPGAPIAMILHPLPQLGGNMNNPVTYQLYHQFVDRGFSVLRFNFRGVVAAKVNLIAALASCPMPPRRWTGCNR